MNAKLFQITEDDLATLERELPEILSDSMERCNNSLTRKRWESVRDIVTRIRWNYGPPVRVESTN